MARKTVYVSDLSGQEIADPVRVTLRYQDERVVVLDVDAGEVANLAEAGVTQKKRGRKPKAA